jgi:rhodanese-related sulfurtransferase
MPISKQTVHQIVFLCLVSLIPALAVALFHPHAPNWDPEGLKEGEVRLATAVGWDNALWIDARSRKSYDESHVPGAVLLNMDDWDALLEEALRVWKPERRIVVYCDSEECGSSEEVAKKLREECQLPDVHVLKGGWRAWLNAQKKAGGGK